MKKGFTLIEMLIVVVVIAILMGMVVRFGNISTTASCRAKTVSRLQRIENALSGYYAAFGTYPPVQLHGSRNIYLKVNAHGIQDVDGNESSGSDLNWDQVQAACKAQPVACYYPYSMGYESYVMAYSEAMKSYVENLSDNEIDSARREVFQAGFGIGTPAAFNEYKNKVKWAEVQIFKFGLLSFLLPRYLFMMDGPEEFLDFAQWTGNNQLPHNPLSGGLYPNGWSGMQTDVKDQRNNNYVRVANIPSQAVCARWISNFENTLVCARPLTLFGINVTDNDDSRRSGKSIGDGEVGSYVRPNLGLEIYKPGGYAQKGTDRQYILNSMTVWDGWDHEFYYYSPAPYQSYILWSAGPNGKTFPPWIDRASLPSAKDREIVGGWIADDIVGLKK